MIEKALKQALEAFEAPSPMGQYKAITSLRQAIASLQQEPVTWQNAALRVGEDLCSVGPFGYYDMTANQWLDWALGVVTIHHPQPKAEQEQKLMLEKFREMEKLLMTITSHSKKCYRMMN